MQIIPLIVLLSLGVVVSLRSYSLDTVTLIKSPFAGQYTNVKMMVNDFPIITYYDAAYAQLNFAACIDDTCTKRFEGVIDGSNSQPGVQVGRWSQMRVINGKPVVAYTYGWDLKVAICNNNCSSIETKVLASKVANNNTHGGYTSLGFTSEFAPVIAFGNDKEETLSIVVCHDPQCSGHTVNVLDKTAKSYPGVAVLNGNPVTSYYEDKGASMKYAYCNDHLCNSVSTVTIDNSTQDIGRYTSLTIGSDGLPIMMYTDQVNGFIKVAHCSDVKCQKSVTISIIDNIGVSCYGVFPEIDIDPSTGFAIMTYFNQTSSLSGSLKMAQCLSADCSQSQAKIISTGPCGYGRDSSIALSKDGHLFVSFLDFSFGMACRLAVLHSTEIYERASYIEVEYSFANSSVSKEVDICSGFNLQ